MINYNHLLIIFLRIYFSTSLVCTNLTPYQYQKVFYKGYIAKADCGIQGLYTGSHAIRFVSKQNEVDLIDIKEDNLRENLLSITRVMSPETCLSDSITFLFGSPISIIYKNNNNDFNDRLQYIPTPYFTIQTNNPHIYVLYDFSLNIEQNILDFKHTVFPNYSLFTTFCISNHNNFYFLICRYGKKCSRNIGNIEINANLISNEYLSNTTIDSGKRLVKIEIYNVDDVNNPIDKALFYDSDTIVISNTIINPNETLETFVELDINLDFTITYDSKYTYKNLGIDKINLTEYTPLFKFRIGNCSFDKIRIGMILLKKSLSFRLISEFTNELISGIEVSSSFCVDQSYPYSEIIININSNTIFYHGQYNCKITINDLPSPYNEKLFTLDVNKNTFNIIEVKLSMCYNRISLKDRSNYEVTDLLLNNQDLNNSFRIGIKNITNNQSFLYKYKIISNKIEILLPIGEYEIIDLPFKVPSYSMSSSPLPADSFNRNIGISLIINNTCIDNTTISFVLNKLITINKITIKSKINEYINLSRLFFKDQYEFPIIRTNMIITTDDAVGNIFNCCAKENLFLDSTDAQFANFGCCDSGTHNKLYYSTTQNITITITINFIIFINEIKIINRSPDNDNVAEKNMAYVLRIVGMKIKLWRDNSEVFRKEIIDGDYDRNLYLVELKFP